MPHKPIGFSWVVDKLLAAMAWPRDLPETARYLRRHKIDIVATLNEHGLDEGTLRAEGIEYHHFPIPDFSAPTMEQVDRFVKLVGKARKAGRRVVVHCTAGRGRTGTMLACFLVSRGSNPAKAIERVRRLRPGSIETPEQEETVFEYHSHLK